jgi:gamma-glutamyltranspeptidase/glutathione hydrolase
MKKFLTLITTSLFIVACSRQPKVETAVATGSKEATKSAEQILDQGGTAADAFIASLATASMSEAGAMGIGGGFFALYYDAKQDQVFAIDAREAVPANINPQQFLDSAGKPINYFPERIYNSASVGIPGVMQGFSLLHKNFGKLEVAKVLQPVISLAESGYKIGSKLSTNLLIDAKLSCENDIKPRLFQNTNLRAQFYQSNIDENNVCEELSEKTFKSNELVENLSYANFLKLVSEHGFDYFYNEQVASEIINTLKTFDANSQLTLADFKDYRAYFKQPLEIEYKDYLIYTMPSPSAGGIALAEILNLAETKFDFSKFKLQEQKISKKEWFLYSELSKIAYFDRNLYFGDHNFSENSKQLSEVLTSKAYASNLVKQIIHYDMKDLLNEDYYPHSISYSKPRSKKLIEQTASELGLKFKDIDYSLDNTVENGTGHIAIKDQYGNWLSATATVEFAFGSGIYVDKYGFFLNNELSDFNPQVDHPNSILSGQRLALDAILKTSYDEVASKTFTTKKPRSSMTPVLALKNNQPVLALGAGGGSTITLSVAQTLINFIDHKLSLKQAIEMPRLFNRDNGTINLEPELFKDEELKGFLISTKTFEPLGLTELDSFDATNCLIVDKIEPARSGTNGLAIDSHGAEAAVDSRRGGLGIIK